MRSSRRAMALSPPAVFSISSGTGILKLSDDKGRVYIVPAAGIAYVEVGTEESRRIGFVG